MGGLCRSNLGSFQWLRQGHSAHGRALPPQKEPHETAVSLLGLETAKVARPQACRGQHEPDQGAQSLVCRFRAAAC